MKPFFARDVKERVFLRSPIYRKDLGESMFADNAKIFIKSGKGGDGHVSFRKELFVPAGGPDGGDGGKGGDIIFEVDPGLNTLTDFRHVRKYVARDGEQGGKKRCHGANAENLVIKVPEGTVIKDSSNFRTPFSSTSM